MPISLVKYCLRIIDMETKISMYVYITHSYSLNTSLRVAQNLLNEYVIYSSNNKAPPFTIIPRLPASLQTESYGTTSLVSSCHTDR